MSIENVVKTQIRYLRDNNCYFSSSFEAILFLQDMDSLQWPFLEVNLWTCVNSTVSAKARKILYIILSLRINQSQQLVFWLKIIISSFDNVIKFVIEMDLCRIYIGHWDKLEKISSFDLHMGVQTRALHMESEGPKEKPRCLSSAHWHMFCSHDLGCTCTNICVPDIL